MLQINVASLASGVHHLDLAPEPAALDLDPDLFSSIQVSVRLDRQPDRILVRLTARANVMLECDRTLVAFQHPLEGTYHVLFGPPSLASGAAEEELRILLPTDPELDLTDIVRDTLLLAIPARKVAPGAEEIDLPVQFGTGEAERDIDPRWEALRHLRSGGVD